MKDLAMATMLCVTVLGCAQPELANRTTRYGDTFGDLEDRMILENLSRFIDDEDRLPSHIDFKQGSVQATDNLNLGATIPVTTGLSGTNIVKNPTIFNVAAAQFQSQDNWTYVPVTDVDDLVRTRCLYKWVVNQSKAPARYSTEAQWITFQKRCLVSGQQTVFKYSPPFTHWLEWTDGFDSPPHTPYSDSATDGFNFLGVFRSHALWGKLREFHQFELAVLGSMPNTTGAAGTGKGPAPEAPALALTVSPSPPTFSGPGQVISYRFRVSNNSNAPIQNLVVSGPKSGVAKCDDTQLAPGDRTTCEAPYRSTPEDVASRCIEDTAVAVGQVGNAFVSAAVKSRVCLPNVKNLLGTQTLVPLGQAPSRVAPLAYPPFSPGKSAAPTVAPPAAPAQ